MKTLTKKIPAFIISALLLFTYINANASHLSTIVTLSGKWKFNLGDDKAWAEASYNDSKWDEITVPMAWEKQGYVGYDGFAWYRKKFVFPVDSKAETYYIQISNIDDVDEIFINGHSVGRTGKFPPEYVTGYGVERRYVIPEKFLHRGKENSVAIRVYDDGGDGGIISGPVRIAYNEDEQFLLINFNENWKFKLHDDKDYKNLDFNDTDWKDIKVPQIWESQGYWNYDGFAWYRESFEIESDFILKDVYLVLGKIDDFDEVYINGKKIGDHWPRKFGSLFFKTNSPYDEFRGYKIPNGLLKKGKNVIAVRVFDYGGLGGIYEGPIGIVTSNNYDELEAKYSFEKHFNKFINNFSSIFFGSFDNY